MAIATVNPATGETVRSFEPLTDAQLEEKMALADETARAWRRSAFGERGRLLRRAADILETGKRDFAALMTLEMGKTLTAAVQEA